MVFVNGFNLGRYWDRGPQKTLYLPGPLLKEGQNEVREISIQQKLIKTTIIVSEFM